MWPEHPDLPLPARIKTPMHRWTCCAVTGPCPRLCKDSPTIRREVARTSPSLSNRSPIRDKVGNFSGRGDIVADHLSCSGVACATAARANARDGICYKYLEIISFWNADQYPAPSLTNVTTVDTLLSA